MFVEAGTTPGLGDLSVVLGLLHDAVIVVDEAQVVVFMNPSAERVFGIRLRGAGLDRLEMFIPPAARSRHGALFEEFSTGTTNAKYMAARTEVFGERSDGTTFPAQISIMKWVPRAGQQQCYFVAVVRDLSELRDLEHEAVDLRTMLGGVIESHESAIVVFDDRTKVLAANEAFREGFLGGIDPIGLRLSDYRDSPVCEQMTLTGIQASETETNVDIRFQYVDGVGSERWADITAIPLRVSPGVIVRATDVTDDAFALQRRSGDEREALTGLFTRGVLEDHLDSELAGTHFDILGIAMFDLDRFHKVNEQLGHKGGDEVLRGLAQTLVRAGGPGGLCAQVGGDRFVVASHFESFSDLDNWASAILKAISVPSSIRGHQIRLTASCGIAACWIGQSHATAELLLKNAEIAEHEAKRRGGDRCVVYSDALIVSQDRTLKMAEALRFAVQDRQIEVHFQPVVDLRTHQPMGCEALSRWSHPVLGEVPPAEFIPLAERNAQIVNIGNFVHTECFNLLAQILRSTKWRQRGFRVSLNVSPTELGHSRFAETFLNRAHAAAADPAAFCLEITEGQLLNLDDISERNMRELADAGAIWALDDFGTGYSSISLLTTLPLGCIKIDRSFVANLARDDRARHLVSTLMSMADGLGYRVIAEGVETAEQASILLNLGCPAAQGFHFAPAHRASEFHSVLEALDINAPSQRLLD